MNPNHNPVGKEVFMARWRTWSWILLCPILLLLGCTVAVGDNASDTVNVTVKAQYEKRAVTSTGLSAVTTRPARYTFANLFNSSTNALITSVDLGLDGTGTARVPRGTSFYAVIYADVLVPATAGGYSLHGNVKKAIPKASYATGTELENEPTWATSSDSFVADSSRTLTLKSLESTSEAGAFAIADQMVEFSLGIGRLESALPLPNFHAFWTTGTGSTVPVAATDTSGVLLSNPTTHRPMMVNEFWYGGPSNGAEAYNDGLLLETFARGLFSYGSYWTTGGASTSYSSVIRGDNDAAFISPWISSEPTLAFASGYATFLACALRNDPNVYQMAANGTVDGWSLAVHDFTPPGGGEFYASSIARAQWGVWKNALTGSAADLQTLWAATTANQSGEYGSAPLGCYPSYLMGVKRLAGALSYTNMWGQLNAENIGNGLDVTLSSYLNSDALWTTVAPNPIPLTGALTTYNNSQSGFEGAYYDRVQAKTYRVQFGDGNHTLSVSTTAPGVIVELLDGLPLPPTLYATSGQAASKTLNLKAGTYAVRVRVDPYYLYNGSPASYSLTIN